MRPFTASFILVSVSWLAATAHADPSWSDAVVKELGAPVAIVAGEKGIHAVSADGAKQSFLLPDATAWIIVDHRGDVLWYPRATKKGTDIMMIDLRAATMTPETMVTGLGDGMYAAVVYGDGWRFEFGGPQAEKALVSIGDKKTRLDSEPGIQVNFGDAAVKKFDRSVKKGKISAAAQKRFAEIYARGQGKNNPYAVKPLDKDLPRVDEAAKNGQCDAQDVCGAVEPLPGTKLQRVTVGYSCGDGCYTQRQLYNPATREFLDPASKQRSKTILQVDDFADVWLTPAGDAFVGHGKVGKLAGGVVTVEESGAGGGWIGGGYYVE